MSSSKRWLKEHHSDFYVKKAREEGYPSRAAFKLLELNEKDNFLHRHHCVVDLGAAPGGWSVVARDVVGERGKVFALDRLEMDAPTGVSFIQGDFTDDAVLQQLLSLVGDCGIDLVMSDMAPNMSGNKTVDQAKSMYLVELAWSCAQTLLKLGGTFVSKVFQGDGVDQFVRELRPRFKQVKCRKPKASRPRSPEIYVVAKGFKAEL